MLSLEVSDYLGWATLAGYLLHFLVVTLTLVC